MCKIRVTRISLLSRVPLRPLRARASDVVPCYFAIPTRPVALVRRSFRHSPVEETRRRSSVETPLRRRGEGGGGERRARGEGRIIFFALLRCRAGAGGAQVSQSCLRRTTTRRSQGRHVSRRIKRAIILVNLEQLVVIKHRKPPGERASERVRNYF